MNELLDKAEKVVVIDHHRRGEEFINNTMLVYMEPYASSTAELVTELIEYQPKHEKLTMLESTALLAGIIVDTKSFTLRQGHGHSKRHRICGQMEQIQCLFSAC